MKLGDLLSADRVVVPLGSETLPAAARSLLERLVAAGAIVNRDKLARRVDEERAEDIVAMGDRAFILHYRTDAVSDLVVAMGTAPQPICRELGENEEQCARIVLLVIAPPRQAARHLQVVSAFARLLSRQPAVDAILALDDAAKIVKLEEFADTLIPEQLAVRDLMTRRPRTVSPDTLLREAAREMVQQRLGALPVVDATGLVVGMLSELELMRHLLSNYLSSGGAARMQSGPPGRRTVRDVMTRQVLCVSPEQPLAEVAALMTNKNVERVPVVREGRLVGFLSRGDIVRKLMGT